MQHHDRLTGSVYVDFDKEDEKGLLSSAQAINEIISAEVDAGTPANKIILGGNVALSA